MRGLLAEKTTMDKSTASMGRSTPPPSSVAVKEESADLSDMFAGPSSRPSAPPSPASSSHTLHVELEEEIKPEQDVKPPLGRAPSGSVSVLTGRKLKKKTSSPPPPPTLVPQLPVAWDEAHQTFETLEKCVYERKDLGLSREQDEMMVCDCVYDQRESSRLLTECRVGADLDRPSGAASLWSTFGLYQQSIIHRVSGE